MYQYACRATMISMEVIGQEPMQVLANHDHFRDMNRMFWEWRATGTYTDLELICQVSGNRNIHRSGAHLPGEWQQERTQILSSSAR